MRTKIGIACNVKPLELVELGLDEEPPSTGPLGEDTYAEWDTAATVRAVERALHSRFDTAFLIANSRFEEKLARTPVDLVFNMAEGLHGTFRESLVPALLEERGIPYTGSDPLTLALSLDKARTKEVLAFHGIPTPSFVVVHDETDLPALDALALPIMVKPVAEGSSKGIFDGNCVRERAALAPKVREILAKYRQPVLAEAFLPGREFTVAVLGNPPKRQVLPVVEINFGELPPGANPIYSYEAKWVWDTPERPLNMFTCPAPLYPPLKAAIEKAVLEACRVLRVRDWCRVDVRLDARGIPNVMELNPLPGILPDPKENSCFPKAAAAAGYSYEEMIHRVVDAALERQG
jgi:D-alanine-D-alanine ligase